MQETDHIAAATGLRRGSFGIGSFEFAGRPFPALVHSSGRVADLSAEFHDAHAIFDDWDRNFERLVTIAANEGRAQFDIGTLRARPPLAHPNLLCAGANYKTHVAQMLTKNKFNQHNRRSGESDEDFYKRNYAMMEQRARDGTPFLWTGLHSSLSGANDDLVLPVLGEQPDWELELGIVIGRGARHASLQEAEKLIAGYVMVNDVGTVDVFRRTDIPWGYDWISKHQPTFKVAGPFIVPSQFISKQDKLQIRLKVNGEVMQDWPADDMVFGPEQLVAYASEHVRLTPGDMIICGSPPGNGMHHGRFLHDGDIVESAITYLGRQRNRCVQEQRPEHPLAFGLWKNGTP
jgi:2,4-didehydro-3-deoxy-L-rhamnonate hydrolase